MINNDIQAFYTLINLEKDLELGKMENLIPQYLRSGIEIFSHQVYASTFALSNPFVKGFILGDEAGLGKTMEALLILAQYKNTKSNILVIVPTPTVENWFTNIVRVFNFECTILGNVERPISPNYNLNLQKFKCGIVLTTYDYVIANAEKFKEYDWHLCILDEAHRFRSYKIKENKTADIILSIIPNAKKILLTATPLQKNEDDLFGLINFIDDSIFYDYEEFHKKYFRKPENYPELRKLLSPYIFRTLREQVRIETKLPERQILTQIFKLTDKEKELYDLIGKYISKPVKQAFPEMQPYELSLMLYGTLSSSTYALSKTLSGIYTRLVKNATEKNLEEAKEIRSMIDIATSITYNNKDEMLLKAINRTFSIFHKKGISKKCVIFTSNTQTQEHIHKLLMQNTEYDINSFNGTTDATPIDKFLHSQNPSVLISTDKGNESLNWQEASFVINYDFPQVLLDMEQRISRCHRIGQLNDVFVLNFVCPDNFSDVRMYELFYKRMNISNSIIGASDTIISGAEKGNIEQNIINTLENVRKKKEVQIDFTELSEEFKDELEEIRSQSNEVLFNTFDKKLLERTKNWAEIIKKKIAIMQEKLNEIARYFYKDYFIDENIFTAKTSWHQKNLYAEPFKYSLIKDDNCHDFNISCEPCQRMISGIRYKDLKFKKLELKGNGEYRGLTGYICCKSLQALLYFNSIKRYVLVGFTEDGKILSEEECNEIMMFDCINWEEEIEISKEIEEKFDLIFEEKRGEIEKEIITQNDKNIQLPLSHIKMQAEKEKDIIELEIKNLQKEINQVKNNTDDDNFASNLARNQKINELTEKLFELKDDEFLKKSKINKETKQKIEEFIEKYKLNFTKDDNFMIYFEVR